MFIYRKSNALSSDTCNSLIETFEKSDLKQPGVLRRNSEYSTEGKTSTDITIDPSFLELDEWSSLISTTIESLGNELSNYRRYFSLGLTHIDYIDIYARFNMQRYKPGEGFHRYHTERGYGRNHVADRVLVWMIYLNDVKYGGETEFYYQRIFEKPEQGKLLIWPADWTYLHKGHTTTSDTKYILTGWINYTNKEE